MSQVNGVVYMLVSPSGKKYIGRTIDFKRRMRRYASEKTQKTPIYLEVQKYGFENFQVEILFGVEGERKEVEQMLNEKEAYFIDKERIENLLNEQIRDGRIREFKLSETTKEKMSKAHLGKKHSKKSREKRAKENAYQAKKVHSEQLKKTFSTLKEAAEFVGLYGGCKISECINGKRKSAGKHPQTKEFITDWKFVQ